MRSLPGFVGGAPSSSIGLLSAEMTTLLSRDMQCYYRVTRCNVEWAHLTYSTINALVSTLQLPDRQHGSHLRRQPGPHQLSGVRPGEPRVPVLLARVYRYRPSSSTRRHGEVHHLRGQQGGVRHLPHYGSAPEDHRKVSWVLRCIFDTSNLTTLPLFRFRCDSPLERQLITISFRSFSPTPGALEYKPGRDYFLVSTSSRTDLHQRVRKSPKILAVFTTLCVTSSKFPHL